MTTDGLPLSDAASPHVRAATQTKPNVENRMGSRGPGTNVMNELLMPHLAKIPPHSTRVWIATEAGYKPKGVQRARRVSAISSDDADGHCRLGSSDSTPS